MLVGACLGELENNVLCQVSVNPPCLVAFAKGSQTGIGMFVHMTCSSRAIVIDI